MHISKRKTNKVPLYVIVAHLFGDKDKHYMAWQNLPWDDDGSFWTSRQVLDDILKNSPEYNMPCHQFAFAYPEAAAALIRVMRKQGINMYDAKVEKIYT